MGQIRFITSLVMISLFAIAIVSYAVGFASDNDSTVTIAGDELASLNTDIKAQQQQAFLEYNSSSDSFMKSSIKSGDEVFESGGAFKSMGQNSTVKGVYNILNIAENKLLGGKDGGFGVFINSFIFLLGFIFIAYIYKTWVGKNPD